MSLLPRDRAWSDYPVGTKAHSVLGGYWLRTKDGWRANGGDAFPHPGADASGDCIELPDPEVTQLIRDVENLTEVIAGNMSKPVPSTTLVVRLDDLAKQLDDRVAAWHKSDTNLSLQEFLSMTPDEFSFWARTGVVPVSWEMRMVNRHE